MCYFCVTKIKEVEEFRMYMTAGARGLENWTIFMDVICVSYPTEFLKNSQKIMKVREVIYFNTQLSIHVSINTNLGHLALIYLALMNAAYQFS